MTSEHEPDLELKAELDRLLVTPAMPKTWDDVKERARRKGWTPKRQKHLAPQIDSEAPDQRPPDTARARAHRRSRGTRFTAYASSGGQASQPVATSAPGATPVSLAEPPRRLLIVGNLSLAPSGGLETDLAALAESLDPARTIDVDFVWGWMSSSAVFGEDTVRTAIRDGDYDVVMLQLQEDLVEDWGESTGSLFENARLFDQEIKDAGARTVLFMSWPWKDDAFPTAAWATLQVIAQAHRDLGSALEAPVTPIALAFAQALEEQPGLAMVGNDWMPTEAASYLAACVVYATLFGESPAGATYAAEGVSTDGAAFLQRVAWDTVTVWYGK
jgi:hypothetical protein